jgi:cell division protein FtsI (penicillin-binding protein 3)
VIRINCLGAHGRVTARDIIVVSCNAGAAYASDLLGEDSFYEGLKTFGFGSRTLSGSPGETAGFLRSTERWSGRSKPTIAMGQEISVSAMQVLQAASAIANDGLLVPPRMVSRIISADGKNVQEWTNAPARQVLSPETARAMRSYMVDVTSDIGTGWRANVEDLSLAVKTGTAQIINPATLAYSDTDFIASCIALLPAEDPSLILYLAIVKPRGEYLGGVEGLGVPAPGDTQIVHQGFRGLPDGRCGDAAAQDLPLGFYDHQVEDQGGGLRRKQGDAAGDKIRVGIGQGFRIDDLRGAGFNRQGKILHIGPPARADVTGHVYHGGSYEAGGLRV